jgi:four helix bundle protein
VADFSRGGAIQSFMDLEVWQMAMALAEDCYKLTSQFPSAELYGMTSQIRRASVSAATNIAEGHGRESTASFIQFCRIAQGSLKEVQTLLLLSERVRLTSRADIEAQLEKCDRTGKMLRALIRSLERRS